ncbi:uncharacterized protein EI97DRAFT_257857 [Westerdykella ornata]|uniref:Zn(2)-C6 fungal-type domain-containing protein n=1 Tax=Westerdykella ornata TaxID=318751 RepID=A0A6A6JPL3_WESOR|nr:uncharacterized protein EI97DRAFT_257857 [Westerdykella ornata]KAF2278551.1 hypothetical protein EI97DRAFT_257857 [Westerdykella ornata]
MSFCSYLHAGSGNIFRGHISDTQIFHPSFASERTVMDQTAPTPPKASPYYLAHSISSTEYGDYFHFAPSHTLQPCLSGSQRVHPPDTVLASPTCAPASPRGNLKEGTTGCSTSFQHTAFSSGQDSTLTPIDRFDSCHLSPQSSGNDPNSDSESLSSSCHPTSRSSSFSMGRVQQASGRSINRQPVVKKGIKASAAAPADRSSNGLITPAGGSPDDMDIPADGYEGGDYVVHYQCGKGHILEDLKPGDPRYTDPWLIICEGEEKPCPLGHFVLPKKEDPLLQPNALIYCPYCGQMMTRSEHMERHIRTHTRVRNMVCVVCTMAFGRSECAKRHMASCHGRLPDDVDPDGSRSTLTISITQGAELVDAVPHPNYGPRTKNSCKPCATSKIKCDKSRGSERCENCRKKNWECKPQDPKKGAGKGTEARLIKPGQHRRRKQSLVTAALKSSEASNVRPKGNRGAPFDAAHSQSIRRASEDVLLHDDDTPEESINLQPKNVSTCDQSAVTGDTEDNTCPIGMYPVGECHYDFGLHHPAAAMESFQAGCMEHDYFPMSHNEGMRGEISHPNVVAGHPQVSSIHFSGAIDNGHKFFPNMFDNHMQQHQQLLTPPHSEFFDQQSGIDPNRTYHVPHQMTQDDALFGTDMSTFHRFPPFDIYESMDLHMQPQ